MDERHVLVAEGSASAPAVRTVGRAVRSTDGRHFVAVPPRVEARGKFLFAGDDKLYVRGVTYGTFRPDEHGREFHDAAGIARDFAAMAAIGVNAVRTYTVPPLWLLDLALEHGLRVLVGLPWEQHVAFLSERSRARAIEDSVRAGVQDCVGHPAVLGYAIGNEIPASIVRWHGRRRMERFLERLYRAAKSENPAALVTYINYPSSEYLQLPFVDVVAFNVYLEEPDRLAAYLARLQTVAGDKPLLVTEVGLDSSRHGEREQARALREQLATAFAAGCAGAFVYSWTDEWHRGGLDVDDWSFGLTDRRRRPKRALAAARDAFGAVPLAPDPSWPRVSVVVCTHNGARTLESCLADVARLDYPDYEVIVVDDGSTDGSATIARSAGARVISTPNRGLSSARNTGLESATGEIVAYLDDDARPDRHWLAYLAHTISSSSSVAVGGPNLPPPDGAVADAIANAPGGPMHVLLSDRIAEHIPGCNMAFRRQALEAVGGFDPQFRIAGDDVDICWRIQERGWTIAFHPAAVVWHHRRNSIRAYLKQQIGYGKAEALLERKWPEKYNIAGHTMWAGRLYGGGPRLTGRRWRIYYGTFGSGLFQRLYRPAPTTLASLPLLPEWSLLVAALGTLAALGLLWSPLVAALPLFLLAAGLVVIEAGLSAARSTFPGRVHARRERLRRRALIALLHVLQPPARLLGRFDHGLTPWRRRGLAPLALPRPRLKTIWSERWAAAEERLARIEHGLRGQGVPVARGGDFDRWDLEVRGGLLGAARLRLGIEEHGRGRQLLRFRAWPRPAASATVFSLLLTTLAVVAGVESAWSAAGAFAAAAGMVTIRTVYESAVAMGSLLRGLNGEAE